MHLLASFPKTDMFGSGTIYKAVTKGDVESIPILVPPDAMERAFERVAAPIWEQIKTLATSNAGLRVAGDLLLPKLISGEIDVARDEAAFAEAAE